MKGAFVVGVDVGTQSVRTIIYDLEGTQVAESRYKLHTTFPAPGRVEQNADYWWIGLQESLTDCLAKSEIDREAIIGIGIDGTSCTVVPVGPDGEFLARALLWMDVRASEEAKKITELKDPVMRYAGWNESAEWMIPKIMWMKEHAPDVYERTWRFAEAPDYLVWRLTGRWVTSVANATHKRHYLSEQSQWPERMLDSLGCSSFMDKWPTEVVAMGQNVGGLSKDAARELGGLRPGIAVTHVGPDAHANMIGLKVLEPGQFAMSLGTSTTLLGLVDSFTEINGVWGPFKDALLPGLYVVDTGQLSTGAVTQWYKDLLFEGLDRSVEADPWKTLEAQALQVLPGSDGLIVLEYWQGNRTPYNDPLATGAMWGLTLKHTAGHLYRAILEGTAYGARNIIDTLTDNGVEVKQICAGGGGSQNRLWVQIHADILGRPITVASTTETACLGCAIAAAVATGEYSSLAEAADSMVQFAETVTPSRKSADIYESQYRLYLETYQRLKDLMHSSSKCSR